MGNPSLVRSFYFFLVFGAVAISMGAWGQQRELVPLDVSVIAQHDETVSRELTHVVFNQGDLDSTYYSFYDRQNFIGSVYDTLLKPVVTEVVELPFKLTPVKRNFFFRRVELSPFRFKDNASVIIKYLDIISGLPNNSIYEIYEDHSGEIWFSYPGGIGRLSGSTLYMADSKSGFPDYSVTGMAEFNNAIYLGTFGGGLIQLIDDKTYLLYTIDDGFKSDHIVDLLQVGNNLYCATYSKGLLKLDETEYGVSCFIEPIGKNAIISSLTSQDGVLYFTFGEGFGSLYENQAKVFSSDSGLPEDSYELIKVTPNGKILLSAQTNFLLVINGNELTSYAGYGEAAERINDILVSMTGVWWLATERDGLYMISGNSLVRLSEEDGLPGKSLGTLFKDSFDDLWIGTRGSGLALLMPSNFQLRQDPRSKLTSLRRMGDKVVALENKDAFVIYSDTGYYRFTNPALKNLTEVAFDRSRNCLWLSSQEGLYQVKQGKVFKYLLYSDTKFSNNFQALELDYQNNLWLCDYNFGVFRYDGDNFTDYPDWARNDNTWTIAAIGGSGKKPGCWVSGYAGKLSYFEQDSIWEYGIYHNGLEVKFSDGFTREDTTWFVTNFGIVFEHDHKFRLLQFDVLKNLGEWNGIYAGEQNNELFATTGSHLVILDSQGNPLTFAAGSEIVPVSFSRSAICQTPGTGELLVGTNKGFLTYTPFGFRNQDIRRKMRIRTVELKDDSGKYQVIEGDEKINYDSTGLQTLQELEVPLEQNSIRITYYCVNWGKDANSKYYYRLDDSPWVSFSGTLELLNLEQGLHKVEAMAILEGKSESEKLIFSINVIAPFYMQGWFIFLLLSLVIAAMWLFVRRFSAINFDSFKANTEASFLAKKMGMLSIAAIILLLGVDYFHGEINHTYPVKWWINLSFSAGIVSLYVLIQFGRLKPLTVSRLILFAYILFVLFVFIRVASNGFHPILSLETALTLLFSIFVLVDTANIILFFTATFFSAITLVLFIDGAEDNETLFISALGQVFITIVIFSLIERTNLSRIMFASKLLQFSRQFVLVANRNAEIVYINDFLLNHLGLTEKDVVGTNWWRYRGWDEQKIEEVRAYFANLIDQQGNSTYTNSLENRGTGEIIQVEWQDTAIESSYVLGIGNDITEKLRYNKELEKLSLVATTVINGVIITNGESEIEWANISFLRLMEYNLEDMVGKKPLNLFTGPGTDEKLLQILRKSEPDEGFEILLYSKSRNPVWFMINVTKIYGDAGDLVKKVFILTDITLEVGRRNRTAIILNNSGDLIYTCDLNGCFDYVNSALGDLLGYSESEFLGKHYSSVIYKEDFISSTNFYSNLIRNKNDNTQMELRVVHKTGRVVWIRQTVNFIYDDNGRIEGFLAIAKDVTESKELAAERDRTAQKELLYSGLLNELSMTGFGSIIDFISRLKVRLIDKIGVDIINVWTDSETRIEPIITTAFESAVINKLVIQKEDASDLFALLEQGNLVVVNKVDEVNFMPRLLSDYIGLLDIKSILAAPIISGGKSWGIISFETNKKYRTWSESDAKFIKGVVDILAANIQLDLRRKAEIKIQESEANFRLLNETIDDVFWLMDLTTRSVIYISPSSEEVLGVKPELFYTTDNYWKNYVLDEDKARILLAHKEIEMEGHYTVEYRIKKGDEIRWIAEKSFGIRDANGQITRSSGICTDITDRKNKEQIIEQQNIDIISSINYAQRIQFALLPDKNILQSSALESAIFYKPKDIIGGDFYWFDRVDDILIIAMGDCTGHGVPGALMTSLGINGLINAVTEQRMVEPAKILTYLDGYITSILSTGNKKDEVTDGMDVTVLAINERTKKIIYSSAARPLISVVDATAKQHPFNRKSIGSWIMDEAFVNYEIPYEAGAGIYLFSDGMVDQFGGERGRRLGSKMFYDLCTNAHSLNCTEQVAYFTRFYADWMGDMWQTDDMVCVLLKLS